MAQFTFIYKGGGGDDMNSMTEEESKQMMDAWYAWSNGLGDALKDMGTPFAPAHVVTKDGTQEGVVGATGYSVVEADSMEAAVKLTEGHPHLNATNGAIEVYEQMPM